MGLDISLYTAAENQASKEHERAWDEWWKNYHDEESGDLLPQFTKEQAEAAKAKIPPYAGSTTVASEKHPKHLFNRRYLRSSYNGGGFNAAVPDMVGEDHGLYWIFEPVIGDNPEPYETEFTPASIPGLEQCKERALQVAQEIRDCDPLRTMSVSTMLGGKEHMWHQLPTEEQVLEWYREEQQRHKNSLAKYAEEGKPVPSWITEDHAYSNAKGEVLGLDKGMEILAVTLGANPMAKFSAMFDPNTVGGQMGVLPCPVLVYRMSQESKDSYIQSAEITAEFCDEAIELIKQDGSCMMHWSG